MEVVMIGAGVANLGGAWMLQRAGFSVTVLERASLGDGASGAAAGMLSPSAELRFGEKDLLDIEMESLRLWSAFVGEVEDESAMSVGYNRAGTLLLGVTRDDMAAIEHTLSYRRENGMPAHRVSCEDCRDVESGVSPRVQGGLHFPDDHQIDARLLVKALGRAFEGRGGALRVNTEVRSVNIERGAVCGVTLVSGEVISAKCVVVGPGAWLQSVANLGIDVPRVRPVRGQIISLELGDPPLCQRVLRSPRVYLVPKTSGELLVGSTMEDAGFDDRLTAGGVRGLLEHAREILPAVEEAPIVSLWTGFRPVSTTNMPTVRPAATSGLVWSVGHGRHGILLAPWTARVLARGVHDALGV